MRKFVVAVYYVIAEENTVEIVEAENEVGALLKVAELDTTDIDTDCLEDYDIDDVLELLANRIDNRVYSEPLEI